jgi:hypothetical protein
MTAPRHLTLTFSPTELHEMGYIAARQLSNGEWAGVAPMTFGKGRLCTGLTLLGYEDGWCYASHEEAITALFAWDTDVSEEPEGWFRHPTSGRRRAGGDATTETVNP